MNILASFDWLKEYLALKETPEQFAARVSLSGPGVERLYPQGQELEGIVLGLVREVNPHPNADKLRVAKVDAGSALSIVCGGSNLAVGQWVAVAKVGAKVKWHGEGELVELKPTEIRGVASEGMICAANEIGLFDAFPHAEREILVLNDALELNALKAGSPLADVLGLAGDVVMDIEVTTNRPDAAGMVGLAREAAAILKRPFTWKPAAKIPASKAKFAVTVADKKLCPRYLAVKLGGIKVGPSPWWLKRRLLSAGLRPVNNVVDITNFVMLELGHPIHAFDAEKLAGEAIEVRRARAGESMAALDGKTYTFDDSTLVIADAEKPVAVAGIMGGEHSGVTGATTSLVFEAATFDPVSVRRSARKLNLYSDAQLRFEKGLSTEAPALALVRAVELCLELAGGVVASAVVDVSAGKYKPQQFSVETAEVNALIGVDLPVKEMKDTLSRLGFKVGGTSKKITAVVPWWRDHDIESGRDLVEEMARVYGYANIPAIVPVGVATQPVDAELVWEDRVRTLAKGAGYTETYSYSFVSKELLEKAGYSAAHALRIQNPLSTDFEFMRPSLLPSLIQTVVENQERFRAQQLFEVAHVYVHPTDAAPSAWKTLPVEALHLGAARLGGEQAWREAKGFVEHLLAELGIQGVTWTALKDETFWHPGRSVQAFQGEHLLATVGELHPSIAEAFKLEGRLALVSMPLAEVFGHATATKAYVPLPVFPEAKRDLAVVVDRGVEASNLIREMREANPLVKQVEWFDTYIGKGLADGKKSVAFHLVFATPERTLSSEEVDAAMERIEQILKQRVGAEVRR
jgi:phenylalanyl-tRNA synthetase beta chain